MPDHAALMWTESVSIADTLDELPDESFDHDSLCEGWRVRDVIGHMLAGHTTPMPKMIVALARYRFNVDKGSFEMSRDMGGSLEPDEIRRRWRSVATEHTRKGIARTIPYRDGFLDHFVHHSDIRRPLGMAHEASSDVLVAAIEATHAITKGMFTPGKNLTGLRVEATDVDWSAGEGPVVRGPAEALVLAAAGRPAGLPDLEGDGVATLSERIGADK